MSIPPTTDSHILSDGDAIDPASSLKLNDQEHYFLSTPDFTEPGLVRFTVTVVAETPRAVAERVAALRFLLTLARKRSGDANSTHWVTYILQRGTELPAFYDIVSGSMSLTGLQVDGCAEAWDVELTTLPVFRWPQIELDVSGELTNGAAMLEVLDVPGDYDALVRLEIEDTSDPGAEFDVGINRIRAARLSGDGVRASDWTPFVNFDAVYDDDAPETYTVEEDASSIGEDFVRYARDTDGGINDGALFAQTMVPAGELNQGERDVWVRVRSDADPIAMSGVITATVMEPEITTEEVADYLVSVEDLSIEPDASWMCNEVVVSYVGPDGGQRELTVTNRPLQQRMRMVVQQAVSTQLRSAGAARAYGRGYLADRATPVRSITIERHWSQPIRTSIGVPQRIYQVQSEKTVEIIGVGKLLVVRTSYDRVTGIGTITLGGLSPRTASFLLAQAQRSNTALREGLDVNSGARVS